MILFHEGTIRNYFFQLITHIFELILVRFATEIIHLITHIFKSLFVRFTTNMAACQSTICYNHDLRYNIVCTLFDHVVAETFVTKQYYIIMQCSLTITSSHLRY